MKKKAQDEASEFEHDVACGRLVEVRLFIPNDVANRFRQVAKKSRMTIHALLEDLVETYAHGLNLEEKKKPHV